MASAATGRLLPAVRPARRLFDRLARRQFLAVALVGLAGFIAPAAFCLRGIPAPGIHDEFSYLLEADTFASGRLANPSPPFWQHFESMHIIQQPTYAGKYPPGQGLMLALGQILTGYPMVGVWIGFAAACAAITWMLQGWIRPRWALLGGMLAVLWLAPTYWGHSYWGGALAACGGALVYGSLPRIVRQGRWLAGLPLGLGLAVLMFTRPYEGFFASLPAAAVLLVWLARLGWRGVAANGLPMVAAIAIVIVPALAWQAFYDSAVTGDPWVMPYKVHDAAYAACPTFVCQAVGAAPHYRHPELADFHVGWERARFQQKQLVRGVNGAVFTHLVNFLEFFVGTVFLLPLVVLWRNCRDRWLWLAAAVCGLVFLALTQTVDLNAHYAAPVTALVFVQIVAGLRVLRGWRGVSGIRAGRWLVTAIVVLCVLEFALPLGQAWSVGLKSSFGSVRQKVLRQLESDGQRHLVFVRYSSAHDCHREWVYNRANIDAAPVVWAREISPLEDQRLREYYSDRKAWVVIADAQPPRLLPLDDAAVAAYPRRPNPYLLETASHSVVVR